MCLVLSPTSHLPKAQDLALSNFLTLYPRLMQSRRRARKSSLRMFVVRFVCRISTSATRQDLVCVCYVVWRWKLSQAHTLLWLEPVALVKVPCMLIFFRWETRGSLVALRIQLIERFYNPLAGEIYVSVFIVKFRFLCPDFASLSWIMNPFPISIYKSTVSKSHWYRKSR